MKLFSGGNNMKIVITHALSIRQPWLFLILNGYKDMEIRTINVKFRGMFGLHASKQFDHAGYSHLKENYYDFFQNFRDDYFKTGGIVGVANLWNIMKFKDKAQFHIFKGRHLNDPDQYNNRMKAYVLQDIHMIKEPIPYKGQLGLFKLEKPLVVITK
jgi:hypothetical protein